MHFTATWKQLSYQLFSNNVLLKQFKANQRLTTTRRCARWHEDCQSVSNDSPCISMFVSRVIRVTDGEGGSRVWQLTFDAGRPGTVVENGQLPEHLGGAHRTELLAVLSHLDLSLCKKSRLILDFIDLIVLACKDINIVLFSILQMLFFSFVPRLNNRTFITSSPLTIGATHHPKKCTCIWNTDIIHC